MFESKHIALHEAEKGIITSQSCDTNKADGSTNLSQWAIPPVINLTNIEALPQASQNRELKRAADNFASTGRNLFVHYTMPVLKHRREILLASGKTKKKYTKTPAQLFQSLDAEQTFFWNHAAKQIQRCLKEGVVSYRDCLIHAGMSGEREQYIWYAEMAVAGYLNLAPPEKIVVEKNIEEKEVVEAVKLPLQILEKPVVEYSTMDFYEKTAGPRISASAPVFSDVDAAIPCGDEVKSDELLDTFLAAFSYESNMLYSHFAHYDFNSICEAEGKRQLELLRQLADKFDKTGKVLCYYYVVPRLCKDVDPPAMGETVTSKAAKIWQFLSGPERDKWVIESAVLKKKLGDGDVAGLETLRLESLDATVLRLHGLAQAALEGHKKDKNGL